MAINLNGTTGITTTGLTSSGIDDNATSTAMTLDTSGNVLVGTTSSFGSSGITLGSNNVVYAAASSQNVANFQRYTTDGEIVRFGKDGSTVGSIGVNAGFITVGKGDTGLLFHDGNDAIWPRNLTTLSGRDGAIDLGGSGDRFKDLYLSGGVYLGGAGASNHLDDYEEGSFTPSFRTSNGGAITLSKQYANYVKVGDLVYIECGWYNSTQSASFWSGQLRFDLPFNANYSSAVGNRAISATIGSIRVFNTGGENVFAFVDNAGHCDFYSQTSSTAWANPTFYGNNASPDSYIHICLTYRAS